MSFKRVSKGPVLGGKPPVRRFLLMVASGLVVFAALVPAKAAPPTVPPVRPPVYPPAIGAAKLSMQPLSIKIPIKAKGIPVPRPLAASSAMNHENCWRFDLRGYGTNHWGTILYEFVWNIAWCADDSGHITSYPWAQCFGTPWQSQITLLSKSCPQGYVGYGSSPVRADWHFKYTYSSPYWDYYPRVDANVYHDGTITGTAYSA
ncbi:MAG: hypothetical protein ACRDKS_12740 [Actinomycetota bacterium]